METLLYDLRYALRLFRNAPTLTVLILLTVALGVGANASVFAVIHAALLKKLPYPDADRILVAAPLAPAVVLDWRDGTSTLSAIAALREQTFDVTATDLHGSPQVSDPMNPRGSVEIRGGFERPERIDGAIVNANFFEVMGVPPAIGRGFTPSDEQQGARVVVLGDAYWRRKFGGDPRILGSGIVLNGERFVVVGVMPPGFDTPAGGEAWVPPRHLMPEYPLRPNVDPTRLRGSHYLAAYARLKPGLTLAAAQAEQRRIFTRLLQQYPADMEREDVDLSLQPLRDWLVGDLRAPLVILFAAVGLVLLIACANIANLLLARATARTQELSLRVALGAGRLRIVRQLLTESVLLALAGGAIGLLLAAWAQPILTSLSPADVRGVQPTLSVPVILFCLALSLLTGVVFGIVPAMESARGGMADSLKTVGRSTESRRGRWTRQSLIVTECAISVALLVIAGLLIRSFAALQHVDPGFSARGLITARIVLPAARYATPEQQAQFFDRALERLRAVPGLERTAAAARLPFVSGNSVRSLQLDRPAPGDSPAAGIRVISPGYFDVIGQPLRRGRAFTPQDRAGAAPVAIVNEAMARRFWPATEPIGHRFRVNENDRWMEIVGVVADVKHESLREPPAPEFYQPYAQAPWSFMVLVVRSNQEPRTIAATMERTLAAVDPSLPPPNVRRMSDLIGDSVAMDRFEMIGLALFAALALALAMIGLYGVMSYLVSRRTREIGVRIALGATPASILQLVMTDGLGVTALGIVIGLVAAAVAARGLRSWLFGIQPSDPLTFAGVTLLLVAISSLASYIPARRATAVDPIKAVRAD